MSKKYILNKTNSVLILQDNQLKTVVKLQPRQCSFQAFDELELMSSPYIYKTHLNGFIELLDERVEIIAKSNTKDYGQKYPIGTKAYLNDKNNLDIEIVSYNPNNGIYTVKILRTGGKITASEKSISLKKHAGEKISADVDEFGDIIEANPTQTSTDLSLPQQPEQVQIIHTEDTAMNKSVNAAQLINNQNQIADQIASQKVDVVYSDPESKPITEDDEETFIVKSSNGKFAKEISSSEMMQNTAKAINETLQQAVTPKKTVKEETKQTASLDNLTPETRKYIEDFLAKDDRQKKMVIARLKDLEKLSAIANYADELSMKAAKVKIEKLSAK